MLRKAKGNGGLRLPRCPRATVCAVSVLTRGHEARVAGDSCGVSLASVVVEGLCPAGTRRTLLLRCCYDSVTRGALSNTGAPCRVALSEGSRMSTETEYACHGCDRRVTIIGDLPGPFICGVCGHEFCDTALRSEA